MQIVLAEYDVVYMTRKSVKGSTIAYHMVEFSLINTNLSISIFLMRTSLFERRMMMKEITMKKPRRCILAVHPTPRGMELS